MVRPALRIKFAIHSLVLLTLVPYILPAQQVIFKTYTKQDGLVANQVRRVMQDSRGFIWIATWEGVSKYDGHKFTNFSTANGLSFDVINDVFEDRDGKIYVAENNDNLDIIFRDRILKDTLYENATVNRFVRYSDSLVYAATDNWGLMIFKKGSLYKTSIETPVISDFIKMNDSLVFILDGYKPFILDREMKRFSLPESDIWYSSIATDSKKNIWLCSRTGLKLLAQVQKRNSPIQFQALPSLFRHPLVQNQTVYFLMEDSDGNYWLSTISGLVRIHLNGRVQLFTTKNGLPINILGGLFQDKERNIWISSQVGLIKLVKQNDIQFFTKEDGLRADEVRSIIPDGNFLYLNNSNSIAQINTQDFSIRHISEKLNPDETYTGFINEHNKPELTAFTNKAIQVIKKETRKKHTLYQLSENENMYSAAMDKKGNYFIGTDKGLLVKTGNKLVYDTSIRYRITTLTFDWQGNLWAGTWAEGLYKVKIKYHDTGLYTESMIVATVPPDERIRSSYLDPSGNLWIGTRYNGAIHLDLVSGENYKKVQITSKQGLNSNWVKSIVEDEKGNIWVGTDGGLNKLIPAQNGYTVIDFSRLNNFYGAISCIYPDKNNIIWCGGYPGLVRFKDDQLDTLEPSAVFLTTIRAGKADSVITENAQKKLRLSYNDNQISFEFSAPVFINEKAILYSYRLIGATDTAWSKPANHHSVSYANLKSANYRFEVRAYAWNGNPGAITGFSFTIRPPFWQTWWFYTTIAVLLALSLYGIYRYRINQILRLQKVRNRIATDLHDDFGSTLTNISILSELSTKNLHQPQQAEKYLHRITEEVNASGQALDDIIWSVNSKNDTLEEMLVRMRRFAAELFDHTSTRCHLQLQPDAAGKRLTMEQRRDLYLVYKESLNNIYKHAAAQTVWVELSMVDHSVRMLIRDDGKGFDTGITTERNGLNNLKTRVEKWKGKINIHSQQGKGSDIEIVMPVSG